MWDVLSLWVSDSLQRSPWGPPSRDHLPSSPVTCKPSKSGSLRMGFAYSLNMARRHPQSPIHLPEPTTPADIQHSSPPSSLISKKIILEKIVLCAVYPNATFSHFCQSCSFSLPFFDFFLGFALGLASLNQNNSHNARGERFLWVNDICMKRLQSCRFLSFEDACQPVLRWSVRRHTGRLWRRQQQPFSRKPSAQTLGSPGTQEQHPFSEEIKGDAGWSSWYFQLRSQQGPAAVLCSSPALPFPVQLCSLLS